MRLDIVSIFPDYLVPLRLSLVGRAIASGLVALNIYDLREYTHDRHRTVDDTPFGGGPGMVMKPEPWGEGLDAVIAAGPPDAEPTLIIPTPSGRVFNHAQAQDLADKPWIIMACGRYEGIDARVAEHYRTRVEVIEISIGDYVLAGGEVAALVIAEAAIRLLPGVLGNAESAVDDSFGPDRDASAALEAPAFTKPAVWRDQHVPAVLLSGDHGAIARWRAEAATNRTAHYRPDLVRPSTPPV